MPDPALHARLSALIKATAKRYPYGSDLDEGCDAIADAVLASKEWKQREVALALGNNLYVYGSPKATETLAHMLAHLVTAESIIYGDPEDVRIALARLTTARGTT